MKAGIELVGNKNLACDMTEEIASRTNMAVGSQMLRTMSMRLAGP